MASEVVEEVNSLDPHFFVQNPILLFQLKQVNWILYLLFCWNYQLDIRWEWIFNSSVFLLLLDAHSVCSYWLQVEFLKLVSSGDHSNALKVACSHLGPLAANDPTLLKPLKETLLALLRPNEDALGKGLPLHALATSLQVFYDLEQSYNTHCQLCLSLICLPSSVWSSYKLQLGFMLVQSNCLWLLLNVPLLQAFWL